MSRICEKNPHTFNILVKKKFDQSFNLKNLERKKKLQDRLSSFFIASIQNSNLFDTPSNSVIKLRYMNDLT